MLSPPSSIAVYQYTILSNIIIIFYFYTIHFYLILITNLKSLIKRDWYSNNNFKMIKVCNYVIRVTG